MSPATPSTDPRFVAPAIQEAPATVPQIDSMIKGVIETPPNIIGLVSLVARAAIITLLFAIREKIIDIALQRAKQNYEQSNANNNQNEVDADPVS